MTSIKLTSINRDRLRRAILKHRFEETGATLTATRADLAIQCYRRVFDGPMIAKMRRLPKGWLPEVSEIRVQLGRNLAVLGFSGRIYCSELSWVLPSPERVSLRMPDDLDGRVALILEPSDPLGILLERHDQAYGRLKEDFRNLSKQVNAVLEQATTTGKLVSLWPEAAPFVAALEPPPSAPAPAIPLGELNKMLGLPVEGVGA